MNEFCDADALDRARRRLSAYAPKPGEPEALLFSIPLSQFSRDELAAAVVMFGKMSQQPREQSSIFV